jgi:putative addiction module component (TIGR02574 family)
MDGRTAEGTLDMKTLDEVRDAALKLPTPERVLLAEELLGSVSERPGVREEDLKAVLAERLAAVDRGEMEVIDLEASLAELRSTLASRGRRP